MEPILKARFPIYPEIPLVEVLGTIGDWLVNGRHFSEGFSGEEAQKVITDLKDSKKEFSLRTPNQFVLEKVLTAKSDNIQFASVSFGHPLPEENDLILTHIGYFCDPQAKKAEIGVSLEKGSFARFSQGIFTRKPSIINLLIDRLGSQFDGDIPVQTKPHCLSYDDAQSVSDFIRGKGANELPIVYVSKNRNGNVFVDPALLASKLGGMAHVFLEPDSKFNRELEHFIHSRNYSCFNGAIRVFWPNPTSSRHYNGFWTPEDLDQQGSFRHKDAIQIIFQHLVERTKGMNLGECDGYKIRTLRTRQLLGKQIREIHATAEKKLELMTLYEQELTSGDEERRTLSARVENLVAQLSEVTIERNALLENITATDRYKRTEPVDTQLASTPDVLLTLKSYLNKTANVAPAIKARITQLLDQHKEDITEAETERAKEMADIRVVFSVYRTLNSHCVQALSAHGFDYTDEGKHYKIYKVGTNPDICVTISKTCSDRRAGEKIINDFERTFWNF